MIDVSYFQNQNSNVQGFFNGGTWQTWIKPRGAKLVNFFLVGSGAGGGGGLLGTSGSITGGGAGGNGSTTKATFQASILPDILYIYAGIGGAGGIGGASSTAGSSGQSSFVCLIPDTSSVSNVVLRSGTTPAIGGSAGATSANNTAAAETVATAANSIFWNLGTVITQVGTGGAGSRLTSGNNVVANVFTPGCSGGGSDVGGYISNAQYPFFVTSNSPINTNGKDGVYITKPVPFFYGGTGGGGGTTGGKGGNGSYGCSGGGGGAGTTSAGNGGRGGNGFIIITTSI